MSKNVEYFIGGARDKRDVISKLVGATNFMKDVSLYRARRNKDVLCLYRGHEDQEEIVAEIRAKWKSFEYTSIRITGHSWGGQAAMEITQSLFLSNIPVDELITLDPVSFFTSRKINAGKWVNVYVKQSFIDNSIGKIPVIGNVLSSIITIPTLMSGRGGDYVANLGGQLGYENGAHNIELKDHVIHEDAMSMYIRARQEILNAKTNPKALGIR